MNETRRNGLKGATLINLVGIIFQALTRIYVKWKIPINSSSKELYSNTTVLLSILIGFFPFLDLIFTILKTTIISSVFIGKYLILPLHMLLFHEKARQYFLNENPNISHYCETILNLLKTCTDFMISRFSPSEENDSNHPQSSTNPDPEVPEVPEVLELSQSELEARQRHAAKLLQRRIEFPLHLRSRSVPRIVKFNDNPLSKKRSNSVSDVDGLNFRYVSIYRKPRPKTQKHSVQLRKTRPEMTCVQVD